MSRLTEPKRRRTAAGNLRMKIRKERSHGENRWLVDFGLVGGKRRREYHKTERAARKALADHVDLSRQAGNVWVNLSEDERLDAIRVLRLARGRGMTLGQVWDAYLAGTALLEQANVMADKPAGDGWKTTAEIAAEWRLHITTTRANLKRLELAGSVERVRGNYGPTRSVTWYWRRTKPAQPRTKPILPRR